MLDVSRVIRNPKFWQTVTVTRRTGGFGADGRPAVTTTTLMIRACIQPEGDSMDQQPLGDRALGTIQIWTESLLYQTGPGNISDLLTWKGDQYRIQGGQEWGDQGYHYYTAVRIIGT